MRRLTALALASLLLMSVSSFATDTRVLTMGDNNMVLLDDANIWLFPSRAFEYPKLAIGEFSNFNDDFDQFGIHWQFGSDNPCVLGTYFTDLPAMYPDDLFGANLVPFDFNLLDNRRIDLFYARGFGEYNFGMGLSLLHSSRTWEDTAPSPDNKTKEAFGYYEFAFGLTPSSGEWDIAVDFGTGGWTDEDAAGQTETDKDGFMDIAIIGRYFMQQGPNYTVIPHVGFGTSKRGINYYVLNADPADLDQNDKYTMTAFDLGCGLNYTPATNVLAVADFGILYVKAKEEITVTGVDPFEYTESLFALPYFKIGLDADVFRWMDVRFGATSYWIRETDEFKSAAANTKAMSNWAANDTYLGFGFHWGRLHVDTYTCPEVFLEGFDFISGNGNTDMNFAITALYEMD